jgi:hypothetical protein
MNMPRMTPSRVANVIGNCEWSPTIRGSQAKPKSLSGGAASP